MEYPTLQGTNSGIRSNILFKAREEQIRCFEELSFESNDSCKTSLDDLAARMRFDYRVGRSIMIIRQARWNSSFAATGRELALLRFDVGTGKA
jgi:hypothetical protein